MTVLQLQAKERRHTSIGAPRKVSPLRACDGVCWVVFGVSQKGGGISYANVPKLF